MEAKENSVEDFLSNNKTQFVIPVYQRNYDWTIAQCKQLLDDILEIGSSKDMHAHFIGSIVYIFKKGMVSSGIKKLTIIDGQQRLTTLTLIYLALYKLSKTLKNESLENELYETYLINKFVSEEEDKLKLKPAEHNEKALRNILKVEPDEKITEATRLVDNFYYFDERISKENYETVLKGLSKLMFVEVALDSEKDNPQRIFESLNSTGLALTQSDLIRNYILMGLGIKEQNKLYRDYWEDIEKLAKDESNELSKVSDFFRDFLTIENRKIPNKGKVYQEFKTKYPVLTLEQLNPLLGKIKSLAIHYNKLLNPHKETDKDIRRQLKYIKKLEVNVAYPFLIQVYDDYKKEIIDKSTFIAVLELVQSYTWRRFIIGLPTNALNKVFMTLYDSIDVYNYLYSLQYSLLEKGGVQRFPQNKEVTDALKIKDIYNAQPKNRTYLLERLENHENKEPVMIEGNDDITIEHIFPQNPNKDWKNDITEEDYNYIKENYLNTIANLTLSGNNGKLGNKSFLEKRNLPKAGYKSSRLWLNHYLGTLDKWDREQLERRCDILCERFLKIWTFPDVHVHSRGTAHEEVNIFDAENPKGKKLEYAIFRNERLEVKEVAKLFATVFQQLFELHPEKFFSTDLAEKVELKDNQTKNILRQPLPLGDNYFIEANLNSMRKINRIKLALTYFGMKDDLRIKYAES